MKYLSVVLLAIVGTTAGATFAGAAPVPKSATTLARGHTAAHSMRPAAADGETQIRALERRYVAAFNAKDANAIMAAYAPDVFVFDAIPPRQYVGADAYKKDWQGLFAAFPGPVKTEMSDLEITVVGPVAWGHNIQDTTFTAKGGAPVRMVVRTTDVYRKIAGRWKIVQEHVSFPVDVATGKADLLSKP